MMAMAGRDRKLTDTFIGTGGFNPQNIAEINEIDSRFQLVDKITEMSSNSEAFVHDAPATLRKRMTDRDVSPEYVERFLAQGLPSFHIDLTSKFAVSIENRSKGREILTRLKADWGAWEYDDEYNVVRFRNDETRKTYNALNSEIDRLADHARKATRDLIEAQRNNGGLANLAESKKHPARDASPVYSFKNK